MKCTICRTEEDAMGEYPSKDSTGKVYDRSGSDECINCKKNICGSMDLCSREMCAVPEPTDDGNYAEYRKCMRCIVSVNKYYAKKLKNVYFNSGAGDDTRKLINKLRAENRQLKKELAAAHIELQYKPGGEGYMAAKSDFESLLDSKNIGDGEEKTDK